MIIGVTHNEQGALNMVTKYKGKISTGYSPGEGPNKSAGPQAAGFFRMLKEVTTTQRIGASAKEVVIKDWVLNEPIQKTLETLTKTTQPRFVEVVCLHKTVDEMWESSMGMYSQSDGLLCKSYGKGTNARHLIFNDKGEREWEDRMFGGAKGCPLDACPDYIAKKCRPMGLLKCFPVIDLNPNPYRFETRSINTILGMESSLTSMWSLLQAAHAVKCVEAKTQLQFDGFFGCKLFLVHRKVKSGGRDVFITDLVPTPSFTQMVMEPIKRGLIMNQKAALSQGGSGSINLLNAASQKLLNEIPSNPEAAGVEMDVADQQSVAVNFTSVDPEETVVSEIPEGTEQVVVDNDDVRKKAIDTLLDGK